MAPRFFSSPYKNALATTAKKEGWWAELPVSTSTTTDSADLIKTSSDYWLAQSTSAGHLICLPYDTPGKFASKPQTLQVSSKPITSFDVSRFDDLVAAGADDGSIAVHALPTLSDFSEAQPLSSSPLSTLSHSSGRGVESIAFHPTSSSILLASSREHVGIFDAAAGGKAVHEFGTGSPVWSAAWSLDGILASSTTKDGNLSLFDVRNSCSSPVQQTLVHAGQKCSRHVHLSNSQIFTTGFSKQREREYALWDARNLSSAIKTQRVDTSTAALVPVADVERGIVYLAGKGDMTLRWVEVGGPAVFTEGGTPVPIMLASMALAPPSQLNLMKAEINRLITVTTDAVVPIDICVPRRQYIDFHSDLFPPVRERSPAQDSKVWLSGGDALVDLVPQDPHKKYVPKPLKRPNSPPAAALSSLLLGDPSKPPTPPVSEIPVSPPVASPPAPSPAPQLSAVAASSSTPSPALVKEAVVPSSVAPSTSASPAAKTPPVSSNESAKVVSPIVVQPPTPSITPLKSTPQSAAPVPSESARFNPRWSRKFLIGKTPLKPDYHDVHGLSATMGAEVQMLKANVKFFFFPLSGAGGRLGVHPLKAKGRLPTLIPSLVCGANITDFELDPFDPLRIFIASDDSKIRVFRVPEGGLEADSGEAVAVLQDAKMDRISELKHHPAAKNLLLSVSDDHGHPTVRLWDLETTSVLKSVALSFGAISSAAWSPDGDLLALATKTKKIIVLDPRSSDTPAVSSSHDSIRPVRIAWLSPTHLVSTGFSRSASREVILYHATPTSVKQLSSKSLDVSPAPLFPYADPDTNILLLYSRGERSCHALHGATDDPTPFSVLPSFEHGTLQSGFAFLPKKHNDVKGAEVLHALRLTPSTVEVVAFSVPRARVEFFQDDIFLPTRDTESPTLSAQEWVSGKNEPLKLISLCPAGMTPLSQAPETASVISTRNKIAKGPTMTESQKAEAYMDRLFNAAKADGDEEEVVRSNNRPQDDDDW